MRLLSDKRLTDIRDTASLLFVLVFIALGIYGGFDIISGGTTAKKAETKAVSAAVNDSCVIRRVPVDTKKIALTFDDGPHGRYTEEILDVLSEYNIRATFFVVGTNAEMHPELIEKELLAGHEVENHTLSHVYLEKACDEEIKSEMIENQSIIASITDYKTKFLRPPGGLFDDRLLSIARELDYKIVLWSVDTCDWNHPTPENIAANVLEDVRSGDIILMHDYIGGKSPTPMALELMLPKLIENGYEFVTVSELLSLASDQ